MSDGPNDAALAISASPVNNNKSFSQNLSQEQLRSKHLYNLIHSLPQSIPISRSYSLQFDKLNNDKNLNLPPVVSKKLCQKCGVLLIPGINLTTRIKFKKRDRTTIKKDENDNKSISGNQNPRSKLKQRCLSCGNITYHELSNTSTNEKQKIINNNLKEASNGTPLKDVVPETPNEPEKLISSHIEESSSPQNDSSIGNQASSKNSTTSSTISTEEPVQGSSSSSSSTSTTTNQKNKSAKERSKKRKAESNLLNAMKQRKMEQNSKNKKMNSLNLMDFLQ